MKSTVKTAIDYHHRSKHSPAQSARSAGYLDWQTQPAPFRNFHGTETYPLNLGTSDPDAPYDNLYERKSNALRPFDESSIAKFLELSLGLSAWKSYEGVSWSLRMNPSSGNLHAEESYLLLPPLKGFGGQAGLFHYHPLNHHLEKRADIEKNLWTGVTDHIGAKGFFVVLSAIYWRESWKYGERAFRYCCLDSGHAVAAISLSASLLGWQATCLTSITGDALSSILGFDRTEWHPHEKEEGELLLFIHAPQTEKLTLDIPDDLLKQFSSLQVKGKPNLLSSGHHDWELITAVSAATRNPAPRSPSKMLSKADYLTIEPVMCKAAAIIRQRRSGKSYDGRTGISKNQFFTMLDKTIPRENCPPFDATVDSFSINLLLFVHRVDSLKRGLYFLFRNEGDIEEIKQKFTADFLWKKIDSAPENFPLYLLREGDVGMESSIISCQQAIAGDGAFSVGMIARFRELLETDPHSYRRLFWEAGQIGQVLYLEAEAHGFSGTGIGCYFDDMVHELLSIGDDSYQSMYHFTIGGAVEDTGLTTLAPYHHLNKK